jgi:hypothetical protein
MFSKFYGLLALVALAGSGAFSQVDQSFIYGEVSTIDGEKFKGQLRWGDEETYWVDEFNSTKLENPYNRFAGRDKIKNVQYNGNEGEWNFMGLWKDKYFNYHFQNHQFVCRFGDMKAIEPTGRNEVTIIFKDDSKLNVGGGSNDIGTRITVMDPELGEVKIRWDRINRIDFMQGPSKLEKRIGEPVYGKLNTLRGSFEGFIQWDHEECLSIDKIDGSNNNGRMSIELGNIRKFERFGRGSKITLKSGKEVELFGTNDVDASNRGIVARTRNMGKVLVEWRDFESVEFSDSYKKGDIMTYDDFPKPSRLKGEVTTLDDKKVKGLLVYDVDETYDYEILEGNDYQVKYSIPFRMIDKITPKNYSYSNVTLKSGETVLLGESQDVSDRNDGVMVFESEKDEEPLMIPWKGIKEINFQ